MNGLSLGIAALVPVLIGPLPVPQKTLEAKLCAGDTTITIRIPLDSDDQTPTDPCRKDGCHAGCSRKSPHRGR